ncbi:hypothetical protein P7C70_g1739, partial [Phenoliferia sp. Uapishka_3]
MPRPADPKPHGLPIRIQNLAVPASSEHQADSLSQTLVGTILNAATARPLRRAALAMLSKRKERFAKLLVGNVDAVLHQVGPRLDIRLAMVAHSQHEQGEMMLLVGPPTSNTSTLLRALSCTPDLPFSETTLLDFGLLPPSRFARAPLLSTSSEDGALRSEVVFMNEHDSHFATLSLHDSLMPAAKAKTPRTRDRGVFREEWAKAEFEGVVDSVGLSHAVGTKVGSPAVRGLSGGERKRASVAEALMARSSVLLLDQPTSGLDSSTALTLLTLLKNGAEEGKRTVVITAPSLSDSLYETFAKVLVLSSRGRQVYFGPAQDVEQYFTRLGLGFKRRSKQGEGVVEFLVGCIEGRENDLELERAWQKSSTRQKLLQEMTLYDSKYPFATCAGPLIAAAQEEKSGWSSKSSHYTVGFAAQVAILTQRQARLVISELPTYVSKTSVNLALSVLVGTLFWSLPPNSSSAFTRGSLLFLSVMFNCYLCLAELGKTLEGRDIVRRQSDWGFFGASSLALARIAGDLPLIGAQVLLFGTITMFAALSPNFDIAIRYCGVALNILVVFAGYFIPTPSMRPWLRWIHYVADPVAQSYEAVLSNEFRNLNLICSPSDVVPSGPTYTDVRYQTCLLPGSTPGSLHVSGDKYLATAYDFHHHPMRNLFILLAQALVFLVVGVIATELFSFAPAGQKRLWAKTERVMKKLARKWYKTAGDAEDSLLRVSPVSMEATGEETAFGAEDVPALQGLEGKTLAWKDISLWVDTPLDTRRLLDRVSGFITPGQTCVMMGKTGAGKSTLLNVLAGRLDGVVKGTILVNGHPPNEEFYRTTGYVEQFDLHDEQSTVREALEFSAILRQDSRTPKVEKLAYVDTVLDLLNLTHLQDALIGTSAAGLSLEQRKKVTIAVEVVAKPAILFCDEPTTGLDTKSALRVVKLLRRLAQTGLSVIATIHQPTAESFSVFDNVLLLQRGGKQVFFGPREDAVPFFDSEKAGAYSNPADFLLDAAGAGMEDVPDEELNDLDAIDSLTKRWKMSSQFLKLHTRILELASAESTTSTRTSSATILRQCIELTKRVSRNYNRDLSYSYTKLFTAIVVSLIIGLSFLQLGNTVVSMQNRLFSVFLILFVPPGLCILAQLQGTSSLKPFFAVFMNLGIFKMVKLRGLWHARERPNKTYGRTAFATSLLLSEVPYSALCGSLFFCIWYFLVGFPLVSSTIAYAFVMVQLFFLFQVTWAMWITALAPSLGVIANLLPFFLVSMEAFNGALMPYYNMPHAWKWLYWVSPFQCPSELVSFLPAPGLTCAEYASAYLSTNSGYLVNSASRTLCQFCKASSGDDYLKQLNISFGDRWLGMGVFAAYTFTNIGLVYFLTYFPPNLSSWGASRSRVRVEQVAADCHAKEVAESGGELLVEGAFDAFA